MNRLEILKAKIDALYEAKQPGRADWADWLHENHVFLVADEAGRLARRFGAREELAVAAGMLHDVADAVMNRFDPAHEEESFRIARTLLHESGFADDEIAVIVDDAIRFHSCFPGKVPQSLEGKVMATADALVHLRSDFYLYGMETMKGKKSDEQIRAWGLTKIERDYRDKIAFEEVRKEAETDYERMKALFSAGT